MSFNIRERGSAYYLIRSSYRQYIPDIYPTELQLYKANALDKKLFFLDIKYISCWH